MSIRDIVIIVGSGFALDLNAQQVYLSADNGNIYLAP